MDHFLGWARARCTSTFRARTICTRRRWPRASSGAADVEQAAEADTPADVVLREIVLRIMRFFWKRQHLLTLVQRYERRGSRGPRDRRHRVLRAVEEVLGRHRLGGGGGARHLDAAFLLGLARAAILEHAPGDRLEIVAARVVHLYLHGLGRTA